MPYGWAGHILKIDLSNRTSLIEGVEPYLQLFLGGRGISTKIAYDEIDSRLSPLDPKNKIFFSPGVLTGTPAPGSSRLKVSGVAAGGFLRHSGLGGHIPAEMKWAGYDLIIIEGKSDTPVFLYIQDDSIEFRDARHLWGKDTYETQEIIKGELGESVQVMCIGPGGENAVAFGSIHTDWGSAAGRCGFGGIMGAKNLKAISIRGTRGVQIADVEEFLRVAEQQRKTYADNSEAISDMHSGGDRHMAHQFISSGVGPVGNWEANEWGSNSITSMDDFATKYGSSWHVCESCPISHFLVYDVPGIGKGGAKCTGTYSVTGHLWNNDWNIGFHAYNLINKYGLDVMSTTNIIAFLMELHHEGIITNEDTDGIPLIRGDENAIISAIHKIGNQEGFGQLFKDGLLQGAKQIGRDAEERAMTIKGLEIEPHELRAVKQFALAAATNSTDIVNSTNQLLFGWIQSTDQEQKEYYEKMAIERYGTKDAVSPRNYAAAAAPTVDEEDRLVAADIVGICKWLVPWFMSRNFETTTSLFSLATGVQMSEAALMSTAQRVVTLERAFNITMGMRRQDDTLPRRFFEEPVSSGPYKGEKIDKTEFNRMLDDYYTLRGYDKDGVPEEETFRKYGLVSEWDTFQKRLMDSNK